MIQYIQADCRQFARAVPDIAEVLKRSCGSNTSWWRERPHGYCHELEAGDCSCPTFHAGHFAKWKASIADEAPRRRQILRKSVDHIKYPADSVITLFFVNSGMLYLWVNWALSMLSNGISRDHIVVIGDAQATYTATSLGFTAINSTLWSSDVLFGARPHANDGSSAAPYFGTAWGDLAETLAVMTGRLSAQRTNRWSAVSHGRGSRRHAVSASTERIQ